MKITYEFVNETVGLEISAEWADVLIDLNRQEYNNNQTETRRHISLDGMDYEGEMFADDTDIEALLIQNQRSEMLRRAIETLLPQQKVLLRKIYFDDRSIVSIAREEGVSEGAIRDRLRKIYARMKKVL